MIALARGFGICDDGGIQLRAPSGASNRRLDEPNLALVSTPILLNYEQKCANLLSDAKRANCLAELVKCTFEAGKCGVTRLSDGL